MTFDYDLANNEFGNFPIELLRYKKDMSYQQRDKQVCCDHNIYKDKNKTDKKFMFRLVYKDFIVNYFSSYYIIYN